MSFWKRLWQRLHSKPSSKTYELSESLYVTLKTLANHEGRTTQEVFTDVVNNGIVRYQTFEKYWNKWESLSPRERDVVALTCLGYTNRQISAHLDLSPETIKSHVRNALQKFDVKSKEELRHILASWDFSAWM